MSRSRMLVSAVGFAVAAVSSTAYGHRAGGMQDAATLDRLASISGLYAAVEFFHPVVATDADARAAWNEATAAAVEEIARGGAAAFEPAVARLLAGLQDSATTLVPDTAPGPRPSAEGRRRALRYQGFPPQVNNPYGGGYRPFVVTRVIVADTVPDRVRVDLPGAFAALVRFTEPARADAPSEEAVELPGAARPGAGAATDDPVDPEAIDPAYPRAGARVVAAYRIHAVARHFYPYTELSGTDWDAAVRRAIPALLAARDAAEYALAVAELAAGLRDTHVGLDGPGWSSAVDGPRVPVGVRLLPGGEAVVTGFSSDSVRESSGLERGDVVVAIDGVSVARRADSLARFRAASTPQAMREKLRMDLLGWGAEGSEVALRVRRAGGRVEDMVVRRTADRWWYAFASPRLALPAVRRLTPEIGYVDLTRLERSQVDSVFEAHGDTRALVFDLRGYPRGTAWSIAPRLVAQEGVIASRIWTPIAPSPDPAAASVAWTEAEVPEDPDVPDYAGITVLLIDGSAVSQAEFSGMMFRAANGTLFVGGPTSGANGDITDIALPGRLRLSFTGNGSRWPDGRRLQRRGLVPDIPVEVTIEGIRSGRDEILERAVAVLEAALGP